MSKRTIAVAGLAATLTFALAVAAASASSGPPPLPVSTNGHKVELVASGLKTPTSFAFGDGRVFVGDGGSSEGSAPPNGGVYVLKNGTAVKIASPLKFVAGLAWHHNKLYISGAVLANGDKRTSLVIQNKACVLREKDIMQPKDAKTPARLVYLAIMMMYLDGEASEEPYNEFALRMTEFMGAIQNRQMLAQCIEISRDVMAGAFYKALISCRKLFDFEQECLNYDPDSLQKHASGH